MRNLSIVSPEVEEAGKLIHQSLPQLVEVDPEMQALEVWC